MIAKGLILLAVAAAVAPGDAGAAASRRSRHRATVRQEVAPALDRRPDPSAGRGGTSGNLPFDNQLRKFSDPLGANGR